MTAVEEWRPVPGQEGRYEVSSLGRVRSLPRWRVPNGRLLKQAPSPSRGYMRVQMARPDSNNRVPDAREVHRLVCHAFHGDPRPGEVARHLNGNKLDNRASNLAWGTPSDNAQDALRHGTHNMARRTHCARGHELAPREPGARQRRCPTCRRGEQLEAANAARRARAAVPWICPDCGESLSRNSKWQHRRRKHEVAA